MPHTKAVAKPQIEYAIFDMDGLLIDSERIYTDVTNEILARYGLTMTWEIKAGVMGKTMYAAAKHILDSFPGLEDQLSADEYLRERNEMQEARFRKVEPMAGAVELVTKLKRAGVPIALATGSNLENFKLKTSHLPHMFDHFPVDSILTADSPQVKPGRGKPCPDIFLAAAASLGRPVGTAEEPASESERAERAKGIVFEDARPGVEAGVRAGMNVIWIPDAELLALDPGNTYGSKEILKSLEEFDCAKWGLVPV